MNVAMTLRAKGGRGLSERVGTIVARFGWTAARSEGYFRRYLAITRQYGSRPTLPITAAVLARHPNLIKQFAAEGVEFAIHGHYHNDHGPLGLDDQARGVGEAARIFAAAGVAISGFRAPYLRYNEATHAALRQHGLRWHSSQAVLYDVTAPLLASEADLDGLRRALRFYGAWRADEVVVRPRNRDGLIDIPVALPDDEILIDRLHCTPDQVTDTWLRMLELTHLRRELFTIQLHPERIDACGPALDATLAAAKEHGDVWFATLGEIADWWQRRAGALVAVTEAGSDRWQARLTGDQDVTLLLRERDGIVRPAPGADLVLPGAAKPIVGLSLTSSVAVAAFLRDEGVPFERTANANGYSVYLDMPAEQFDEAAVLRHLEQTRGPLVLINRWPRGARSAIAATGDIDSITIQDFAFRLWETRRGGKA